MFELDRQKRKVAAVMRPPEVPAHVSERGRDRTLEREDRLLFVADREDRAPKHAARADAGGEFGNQAFDDVPLGGRGVLRLINQQMIDAKIKLVVHPGGIDPIQQCTGLVDQVIVIE